MFRSGIIALTVAAVPTGMKGRCPRCGEGNLFSGLLTVKKECSACHLSFDFEDSGDGPTVFTTYAENHVSAQDLSFLIG